MKPLAPTLLLSTLLLAGCSTAPRLTLQQIQPVRVFQLSRAEVYDAVRFFSLKEGFRLDSFEEEIGRIVGHRTHQASPLSSTNKMIIINLRVVSIDAEHSEVTTRFTFSSVNDALNRDEEAILVDCYTTLYDSLERKTQ